LELIALLDQFARDLNPSRGDEQYYHVSDLSGCDRATWARFRGLLRDHDADTYRKFLDGHDIENRHLAAIARVRPDLALGLRVAMRYEFGFIEGKIVDEAYEPKPGEILGHPDGVLEDAVIECKSTEFMTDRATWARIVPITPEQLAWHYKMQAGAYALALNKPKAIVIIECRASGKITGISFNPREMENEIKTRIRMLLGVHKDAPKPSPRLHIDTINTKTGQSWLCKYCLIPKEHCNLNRYALPTVENRELIQI